jgi:hypothetical protein
VSRSAAPPGVKTPGYTSKVPYGDCRTAPPSAVPQELYARIQRKRTALSPGVLAPRRGGFASVRTRGAASRPPRGRFSAPVRPRRRAGCKLRDREVEGGEPSEPKLGGGPCLPTVAVDLVARLVPRPILDPSLALARRERQRDERGARVVQPDAPSGVVALVQLGAFDSRALKLGAKAAGHVRGQDALAVDIHEQRIVRPKLVAERLLPERDRRPERTRDVGPERPRAGVVGLVLVQLDRSAVEVGVGDVEADRLTRAASLAVEEAVEETQRERHVGASEELLVLVGVEVRLRFLGPVLRQEAPRQRVVGAEPKREHPEREHAVQEQREAAPRGGLLVRQRAHDALGVVQREALDRDAFEERVDVALESPAIEVGALLDLHVVGVEAREVARGPALADISERLRLRRVCDGASLARAHGVDRAAHLVERLAFRCLARAEQEGPRDVNGYVHAAEALGEVGEHGAARFRGPRRLARRERDLRSRGRVERDPGVPVFALLVGVPCSLAGHGLSWWRVDHALGRA